jgi:hypothetical protein
LLVNWFSTVVSDGNAVPAAGLNLNFCTSQFMSDTVSPWSFFKSTSTKSDWKRRVKNGRQEWQEMDAGE